MSKAKQVFLILVVVVVVAIVAVLAVSSRSGPVLQEQRQYSEEQATDRLETLKAAQNKHVIEVIPMKFFTEEIRADDGGFVLTAITTMREEDIAAVSFRATNSSVSDAEMWYTAENQGNGRYQLIGSAADLGNRSGTYTIEAFITPTGGGETEAGKTELDVELANYFYSESPEEGKQILVLVGPQADGTPEGVRFKVWSVERDQNDIRTYTAEEKEDGVWTAEIDVHDFSGKGDFIANAYAVIGGENAEEEAAENSKKTAGESGADPSGKNTAEDRGKTSGDATSKSDTETSGDSTAKSDAETSGDSTAESNAKKPGENDTEEAGRDSGESTTESGEKRTEGSAGEDSKETSGESTAKDGKETSGVSAEEGSKDASGEQEAEVGIASAEFEMIGEQMDLPEGAGEVVTEGKRVYVKVPEILQTPELPTGCESVALTIVLQSFGYELEKTEIANTYLEKGTDMATSYVGDPFSEKGAGCFPPAIVNAADKYLKEQEDSRRGHNITGTPMDDLCAYIDNGLPIILWSSMYMADPTGTNSTYTYQGQTYQWYRSEHCVVLYGYDRSKDVYLVSDPLVGLVERDASAFRNIYDQIGKYAVVIY